MREQSSFAEGFNKVAYSIPRDEILRSMSFNELAIEIGSCKKDSPKFFVVERELKRRIAEDQAKINRSNMILSACIGGLGGALLSELFRFIR